MSVFYLVKDYIEVVHKLIETSPNYILQHSNYTDFLTLINFSLTTLKQFCSNLLSFEWLNQLWYFPIIIPEIATSMLEEISVFDGNFHNILTFLDKPIAVGNQIYGNYYLPVTLIEKFFTGLVNSLFIWLPTSTATFLCFRRFIMQGVEAGYSAALGTLAASLFWFGSILFGLRFIVVPWMSLDLFRYWLGFLLLMKYFWDNRYAYKEVKHNSVFGKHTKRNIFGFHFLLALTEQSSLYPFLNNFSISSQSTLLESFPAENFFSFNCIHFSYLLGLAIGSYSLISLLCWFWQDPAYRFYFWIMNKFKKLRIADIVRPVHLLFQTLTVLFAFSSLPYFGMEYQIANPLGLLPNDQVFHQFKQTSFLTHSTSPAYYRSRLNFPRQKFFRYEDWAEYYHRNTPIDTSLYDQGAYRLYTMEDLSYGKDYEWMRRRSDKIKIRSRLKRLRWFPRNWANRLWEFTKTWSRRNVFWRNDILNMYQYSWDSKAPLIWGKLVFEEFFPKMEGSSKKLLDSSKLNQKNLISSQVDGEFSKNEKNLNTSSNKEWTLASLTSNKTVTPTWDSFWGPDPDWSSKFLWNQNTLHQQQKDFWWNWQSKLNLSDNDIWWKWLINQSATTSIFKDTMFSESQKLQLNNVKSSKNISNLKSDFWEPQKRFISIYSDQLNRNETMVEYSILRKFVRKLTARFKVAQIENISPNVNLSSNSFNNSRNTLLLLPSLRDWTVFQTVMTNINQMLWWRCLFLGDSKKKVSNFKAMPSKNNSLIAFQNKQNIQNQRNPDSNNYIDNLSNLNYMNQKNFVLSLKSPKTKNEEALKQKTEQLSLVSKKLYASRNKFEKVQNKYFQIQLKQNNLNSNLLNYNFYNTKTKNSSESEPSNFSGELYSNFAELLQKNSKVKKEWAAENIRVLPKKIDGSTLLHPIKYYLHKEETFKKKLSFYGVKKASNLNGVYKGPEKNWVNAQSFFLGRWGDYRSSDFFTKPINNNLVSNQYLVTSKGSNEKNNLTLTNKKNNLPIFNFYLKTYFQTYKKTKLYVLNTKMKRQLGMGASARRKGRDYSNKLLKRSKILSNTPWIRQWIDQSGFLARRKRLETWIARQHYDPNELWSKIMKLDVDLFMNRQPNSYFLTNTEEKLLHLRRFLLFEHYDSLRWYTFMTNYRTMKNTIGGTKSFTNRLYNQQFKGTFHKVRHLFSLTPSVSNGTLLKFDQSLYNLSSNSNAQSPTLLEELGTQKNYLGGGPNNFFGSPVSSKNMDLIEKSTQIIKQSIWQNNFLRKKYIEESLEQKNYNLLTKSLNSNPLSNSLKMSNVNARLQQSTSIKTNLQTKLMISLFKKRQKWTKDYKRSSERLWKKWKFHTMLSENNTFAETSRNVSTRNIFVESIPMINNMELAEQKKFFTTNKIENSTNLNDSKINDKFVQILKLKRLAGFDNNVNLKFNELTGSEDLKSLKNYWVNSLYPLKVSPVQSSIQYALKDGIKIQSNSWGNAQLFFLGRSNELESKKISFSNYNIEKKLFQNNLFTKKLITERYTKLRQLQLNSISRNLFGKFESRLNGGINKFSLNYKLKNILNNRIKNSFSNKQFEAKLFSSQIRFLVHPKKLDGQFTQFLQSSVPNGFENNNQQYNFDNELNIKLYQKNLFRRERSNIQNLLFMKKFLLNDSNLSVTRSQIRPLPGKRTKALYDRGSYSQKNIGSLSDYYNQNLNKMDSSRGLLQSKLIFSEKSSNINLKIRTYKNQKWLVSEVNKDRNSDILNYLKISENPPNYFLGGLKLSELNTHWKNLFRRLKNTKLLSDQMDETLQKKFIQSQKVNFLTNSLIKQDIPGGLVIDLTQKLQKKLILNNKVSETISLDQNQKNINSFSQKLTKTTLNRALQKIVNSSSSNKNFIEAEIPNVIRLTKSLRKRQQEKITRSLLKRHLNLKSRRKLFLKTKEVNNQRMVIDRNFEIQERLFINKLSFYDQFQKKLQIKNNFDQQNLVEKDQEIYFNEKKRVVVPLKNVMGKPYSSLEKNELSPSSDKIESLNISSLVKNKRGDEITIVDNSNSLKQPFGSTIQKSWENAQLFFGRSSHLFNNLLSWLNEAEKQNSLKVFAPTRPYFKENKFFNSQINDYVLENTKQKQKIIENLEKRPNYFFGAFILQNKGFNINTFSKNLENGLSKDNYIQNEQLEYFNNYKDQSYLSSLKRSTGFINSMLQNEQTTIQNQINSFPEKFLSLKLKEKIKSGEFIFGSSIPSFFNGIETKAQKKGFSISLEPEKNVLRRSMRKFFVNDYRTIKKHSKNFKTLLKNYFENNGKDQKTVFINNLFLKNWINERSFPQRQTIFLVHQQRSTEQRKQFTQFYEQQFSQGLKQKSLLADSISKPLNGISSKIQKNNFSKNELMTLNKYIISSRTNPNKLSKQQMRKKLKKRRIIRSKRIERLKLLKDHPLKFRSEQIQTFYNLKDSLEKWKNFSFNFIQNSNNLGYQSLNLEKYENSQFLESSLKLEAGPFSFSKTYKLNETQPSFLTKNLSLTPVKQISNSFVGDFEKNERTNNFGAFSQTLDSDLFYTLYKDIFLDGPKNYLAINTIKLENNNFNGEPEKLSGLLKSNLISKPLETTNMPFYAGWDESVRKFVLTNRLLSRREAGYAIAKTSVSPVQENVTNFENNLNKNIIFSSWPLKGKNAATTLFSQFPFMIGPQNNSNFSDKQTLSLKGGTKYELPEKTIISENGFLVSKFIPNFATERSLKNDGGKLQADKWKQKLAETKLGPNNFSDTGLLFSNQDFSKLYIKFKKQKRIKTIIKSSKNEDHVGIRQAGQVISNLATFKNRKAARRNLFFSIPWRTKKQTTKSLLKVLTHAKANSIVSSNSFGSSSTVKTNVFGFQNPNFKFTKLFVSANSNNNYIDKKLSAKLLLLRNLRHGNVSQTKLTYLRRLQKFIRPTGSAWRKNLTLSRRKKQHVSMNEIKNPKNSNLFSGDGKNLVSNGFVDYFPNRYNVRKRKKRSNNKNPRLRGDKNFKKTKRQYRQKIYLRPKNRPLRRRSLGVLFQNKLNYWRLNYQNLYTNQVEHQRRKELHPLKLLGQDSKRKDRLNIDSNNESFFVINSTDKNKPQTSFLVASPTKNLSNSKFIEISNGETPGGVGETGKTTFAVPFVVGEPKKLFAKKIIWGGNYVQNSKNLKQNSLYSIKENEWQALNRPKKLYRSLFANKSRSSDPLLYQTLPAHNRSIPLIKNLPLPGSSVKTLNRIVKWSSADGASRFYRVNLSYGWALELFLKDLHQKILYKNTSLNSLSMNNIINEYLIKLMKAQSLNKFSSNRLFKRKAYKLRQLSYTMSMRLYDRWFFYYYKNLNDSLLNKEQINTLKSFEPQYLFGTQNLKLVSDSTILNTENPSESVTLNRNTSIVSLFKHIKKLLTFHLTDSQMTFRSYLKNLRSTAYLKVGKTLGGVQNLGVERRSQNQQEKSKATNQTNLENQFNLNSSSDISKNQKTTGLDSFQLVKKTNGEINNSTNVLTGNGETVKQTDKNNILTSSRSLLKKEKKYAEDRFFFAQFNKPPLVDEYRLTLENNRHYPVNGGFVWPGDYLRLKTILLPKEIKDFYLNEKNKKITKIINLESEKFNYHPTQFNFKSRLP
nr:hypothetical chloroplast RF1 [Uronema sp. CCAP 334/1]